MKICIFADIHGNIDAFNKMLETEFDKVERFIFAGDIFGYFYGQIEIIKQFMSIEKLIAIKGNHEEYYLFGRKGKSLIDKYGSSYALTLSEMQKNYISGLASRAELSICGKRIGIFHGGPKDFLEQRIYPNSVLENECENLKYDHIICAHTHYRLLYKNKGVTIINPGSLGQPRDGKGFSYCIWDTEKDAFEFKTVKVDVAFLLNQVNSVDSDKYVWKYLSKKYKDCEG